MNTGATPLIGLVVLATLLIGIGLILAALLSGRRQRETLRCTHCNRYNRNDAHFCARCGHTLESDSSSKQP